ncbi:MAG: flagellin [Phycisphaerae bacterium]|nr:flagellin [Phycisphaerae bacterium]
MAGNQNSLAFDVASIVSNSYNALKASFSHLASGSRIASAADDAAGMAVRELLRADIATARQGASNVSNGISMLQTAEGAAGVVNANLVRMQELATQASSPTYSTSQKRLMQQEFGQLAAENSRIISVTEFNGTPLFAEGSQIDIALGDGNSISFTTEALTMGFADLASDPLAAAKTVSAAISQTSSYRGTLGASMQRLESASEVLSVQAENLLASKSRISDADVAVEIAGMTGRQIRTQVATAAQVHAGAVAQVLQLLIG